MKNNKSLEHLNVLLRIFFVSGVFQNYEVDFWPLLKVEKVLAPKQFWRENFFSSKFYFLSSIRIYKLSASRIPSFKEKVVHCYTLTIIHSCSIPNPTLVGISKATLDKSLGFAQFKRDFKNKVYTKRFNMHIIIIPEQIIEHPNFKLILVVKE